MKFYKIFQKLKEKLADFAAKKFRLFVTGVMSNKPSARHENFRWPVVMIVKFKKEQKYSKTLKTIANFDKMLLKLKILKSSKPFPCFK